MQTAAIVLVCTANQCRSPMAGALLRRSLSARGADATVATAGFRAGGVPAPSAARRAMARRGLSIDEHLSRRLDPATLASADLVVTMERRHVQEVATVDSEAWQRTFTCTDFLAQAEQARPRRADEDLRSWVHTLSRGRRPADVVGAGAHGDIPDPVGCSGRRFEAVADQLEGLMERLATLAFPSPDPIPSPVPGAPAARAPHTSTTRPSRWRPWLSRQQTGGR